MSQGRSGWWLEMGVFRILSEGHLVMSGHLLTVTVSWWCWRSWHLMACGQGHCSERPAVRSAALSSRAPSGDEAEACAAWRRGLRWSFLHPAHP